MNTILVEDTQHVLAPCVLCEKYQLYMSKNISLHLQSCRNPFLSTPKDAREIGNQGKPASLKSRQYCSINWQQKIARESENLNKKLQECREGTLNGNLQTSDKSGTCLGITNLLPSHGSVRCPRRAPCSLATRVCFPPNLLFVLFDAFHLLCVTFTLAH